MNSPEETNNEIPFESKNIIDLSKEKDNAVCADCQRDTNQIVETKRSSHIKLSLSKRSSLSKSATTSNKGKKKLNYISVTEYLSSTLGIFLCKDCAEVHMNLDDNIS